MKYKNLIRKFICSYIGHSWTSPALEGKSIKDFAVKGKITGESVKAYSRLHCKRCPATLENPDCKTL